MPKDLSGVIRELHESAVGRCRERIEEAAEHAKGLIRHEGIPGSCRAQYGVTSVLKRRHGL